MTDKDILKNFIRQDGTINSGETSLNYMNCHIEYKEYLENRFPKEEWAS